VCGGRKSISWQLREFIGATLNEYPRNNLLIINGGATGVDQASTDWAAKSMVSFIEYMADWTDMTPPCLARRRQDGSQYNALAGIKRNLKMLLDSKPDLVIAFAGGTGTADMVKQAIVHKVKVRDLRSINNNN
jgi:predicted Rossmann-fold nucleotide-binding protein